MLFSTFFVVLLDSICTIDDLLWTKYCDFMYNYIPFLQVMILIFLLHGKLLQISSYSINQAKEHIIWNTAERLKNKITNQWFYFYFILEHFFVQIPKSYLF